MLSGAGCNQDIGGRNRYTACPSIPCKINGTLPDLLGNGKIRKDPIELRKHPLFLLSTGSIPEFQPDRWTPAGHTTGQGAFHTNAHLYIAP